MKKFTYDIIKQPSLSNRLELKTHVLVFVYYITFCLIIILLNYILI